MWVPVVLTVAAATPGQGKIELLASEEISVTQIARESVTGVVFSCGQENSSSLFTMLLLTGGDKALLFWEGVLLEIKRPANDFLP